MAMKRKKIQWKRKEIGEKERNWRKRRKDKPERQ
jgi:hypothetical protein